MPESDDRRFAREPDDADIPQVGQSRHRFAAYRAFRLIPSTVEIVATAPAMLGADCTIPQCAQLRRGPSNQSGEESY